MEQIIRLAENSGKYVFLLLDCYSENVVALHVYEKLGFRSTGERNG